MSIDRIDYMGIAWWFRDKPSYASRFTAERFLDLGRGHYGFRELSSFRTRKETRRKMYGTYTYLTDTYTRRQTSCPITHHPFFFFFHLDCISLDDKAIHLDYHHCLYVYKRNRVLNRSAFYLLLGPLGNIKTMRQFRRQRKSEPRELLTTN